MSCGLTPSEAEEMARELLNDLLKDYPILEEIKELILEDLKRHVIESICDESATIRFE